MDNHELTISYLQNGNVVQVKKLASDMFMTCVQRSKVFFRLSYYFE